MKMIQNNVYGLLNLIYSKDVPVMFTYNNIKLY